MIGDARPRPGSMARAWFRANRQDADRFILTCGGGGSQGWRDWREIRGAGAEDEFNGDRAWFEQARAQEVVLWYLVQWSPAIGTSELHNPHPVLWVDGDHPRRSPAGTYIGDHHVMFPMNTSQSRDIEGGWYPMRTLTHSKNMVGTIRWVQRLTKPPSRW